MSSSYISFDMFKMFGKVRIDTALDESRRSHVMQFNKQVAQNRELMKRFIDVTCFLEAQELAFRGHNEGKDSINSGNYIEMLNVLSIYDEKLNTHLQESSVFSGLSNHIKNDLIQSVATTVMDHIRDEIDNSLSCRF